MDRNGRMQPRGRLPRLEAAGRYPLAGAAVFRLGHPPAVAGDDVASLDKPLRLDLQRFHGRIDVAHRAASRALFAENVPRLQRLTQLDRNPAMMDPAEHRKAEFA